MWLTDYDGSRAFIRKIVYDGFDSAALMSVDVFGECMSVFVCFCVFSSGIHRMKKKTFNVVRMWVIVLIQLAAGLPCQSQSGHGAPWGR